MTEALGPAELGIARAARALRARELSAATLAQASLERIGRCDPEVHAFLHVDPDRVLAQARAADAEIARGRWRGPLHGIPVALKDLIDVAGERTSCHSAIRADHLADRDAAVVTRLREAGAVLLGKTALHEFATGGPTDDLPWPAARNPWRLALNPGGSSSGSGAALAARMAPAALGTDTGGSIRNPATCCGVVGLKPTYGLVSREGVFPLAFSLDHVGPMARDAEDCALLHDAIVDTTAPAHARTAGRDGLEDARTLGVRELRIGVVEHFHREDDRADARIVAAFDRAIDALAARGARIERVRIAPLQVYAACGRVIQQAEQYVVHERWLRERPHDYCETSRVKLLAGAFVSARDYLVALQARTELAAQFARTMQRHDALLALSSFELPAAFDDPASIAATYERHARMPFNVTGTPAIALPTGLTDDGVPLGLQVAGAAYGERMLFRIAHALERAGITLAGRSPPWA